MATVIKMNGAGFNPVVVAKFDRASAFYNHPSHQHYWNDLPKVDRKARLTVVWNEAKKIMSR